MGVQALRVLRQLVLLKRLEQLACSGSRQLVGSVSLCALRLLQLECSGSLYAQAVRVLWQFMCTGSRQFVACGSGGWRSVGAQAVCVVRQFVLLRQFVCSGGWSSLRARLALLASRHLEYLMHLQHSMVW